MAVKTKDLKTNSALCTLWLADTPQYESRKTATIGNFQAENKKAGTDIINQALQYLTDNGFEYAIGPMNGNTWHSYRFVTGGDNSPPFLMEPKNPDFYPVIFQDTGFEPLGEYSSAKMNPIGAYEGIHPPEGIYIREFQKEHAKEELCKIWQLSLETFAHNFLYTPIDKKDFMALYTPILDKLLPEYVLMAETANGTLKGFLFAIPDYTQGSSPDCLIVKTYASLQRGIGGALLDMIHKRAEENGFQNLIHALMYDGNISKKRTAKFSKPFRRYTLYGREL